MMPEIYFKDIRPQESGYKTDSRWLSLPGTELKLKDILVI